MNPFTTIDDKIYTREEEMDDIHYAISHYKLQVTQLKELLNNRNRITDITDKEILAEIKKYEDTIVVHTNLYKLYRDKYKQLKKLDLIKQLL